MKTIKIDLFTARELKEKSPAGFEKALGEYRETIDNGRDGMADIWGDEILASIKGIFAAAGVKLKDYSLSARGERGDGIKAEFPRNYDGYDDPGDLSGPRALAWLENNLLGPLRVPNISIREARAAEKERADIYERKREAREKAAAEFKGTSESARWAAAREAADAIATWPELGRKITRLYHKPGELPDCPFTGLCYDDDMIRAVVDGVKNGGDTLREAFEGLAAVYSRLLSGELEAAAEEDYFIEEAEANDREFTESGEIY